MDGKSSPRKSSKQSSTGDAESEKLFSSYGVYSVQGHRPSMEDAHVALQNASLAFFGVFDGHGGARAAKYCSKHLHSNLLEQSAFKDGKYKRAFVKAFHATDRDFCEIASSKGYTDGTTALVALMSWGDEDVDGQRKRILTLANLGDSRAVLSRKGKPKGVTVDHKPTDDEERARIERYGGILLGGHINGRLGVSRSIGDLDFKERRPLVENMVISTPNVWKYELTQDVEFLILACDGVWDVVSNQNAVQIVRNALLEGSSAHQSAKKLVMSALEYGSTDNITAMVVIFVGFETLRGR